LDSVKTSTLSKFLEMKRSDRDPRKRAKRQRASADCGCINELTDSPFQAKSSPAAIKSSHEVLAALGQHAVRFGDGTEGDEAHQLDTPYSLSFVPKSQHLLVVTTINSNQVRVYNVRTEALLFTAEGDNPCGVAVTADGQHVVVVEQTNNNIAVLRLQTNSSATVVWLEFERAFGKTGMGEGQLLSPRGVATRTVSEEEIYVLVANTNNSCISIFRLDGSFVKSFGSCGKDDGQFKCPYDLTVLPSGEIAVVDTDNHRVQIFDGEGNFKRKFGTRGKVRGSKCSN
jgi:tripartite motif-containing protein 71